MLSIVIPTLNEEKYLPRLLNSIRRQSFSGKGEEDKSSSSPSLSCNESSVFEVIVADAYSEDGTASFAQKENCKVVSSRGRLPAREKNRGAEATQGELILFVDADVVLPEDFLKNAIEEFCHRNLDVASFYLESKNKIHDFIFRFFYNFPAKITQKILPQAMNAILIKKSLHQKIGGFDEEIRLGEELDYIRRGKKIGKFGILNSCKVLISSRRFRKDGWFKSWFKYFLCQLHMIFLGKVKSDIFKYRFNHYGEN
ncbi:MAG: glycosyltransferase [bacterium]|nr:glycosyltransferase [bacterium]